MAQEALKKVQQQLNCPICLDVYTDPKLLQCHHVYCQQCLMRLVTQDEQGQQGVTCPNCRQVTPIPANGVAGLQSAFHINHLLEIEDAIQKIPVPSATSHCLQHTKELELYCGSCEELICFQCAIKGGKHFSHDYELLDQAFESCKREINSSLEPIDKQVASIKKALAQLDACCGAISNQQVAIEASICHTFEQLQAVLEVRKEELIAHVYQITQGKLRNLAVQKDQMETTQALLTSCQELVKQKLHTGSEKEVLKMKTTMLKQMKKVITENKLDTLKPNKEADIIFTVSASKELAAICESYGLVSAPGLPDPSRCLATGKRITVVGEKSTVFFQAINFEGDPCKELEESLECELVSELTSTRVRGNVERKGQNLYHISYQPSIKGRQQLHIKVGTLHIKGSPFRVVAKSSLQLKTPILTITEVGKPYGVAVDSKREIVVVTECTDHCVTVFRPSGQKILSFGRRGSGHGQFKGPRGVTVDREGNILVADTFNHRIQKFTAEGQFLSAVGTEGSKPLQFSSPFGITFNNNKVYVADTYNHRVEVLNSDLTFFSTFGMHGSDEGQFQSPCGIACDSTGNVYVADTENHRIQVFTARGRFLRIVGRRDLGRGAVRLPVGLGIDTSGTVYIGEWGNHHVSVFTSKGQFVSHYGRERRELSCPAGLAVDNGVVYVCDYNNDRVEVL